MATRHKKRAGLSPGTLVHTGDRKMEKVRLSVFEYDSDGLERSEPENIEKALAKQSRRVKWLNIDGLHDLELLEKVGQKYQLHPLVLEDIAHTAQRPKMEEFDDYIYVVLKMLTYDGNTDKIQSEQVSLILGEGYVVSFQEAPGDVLEPLRQRIISGKGRSRKLGSDYLFYAVIDSIIDNYFVVLESMSDKIEQLQQQVITDPTESVLQQIHLTKRQMLAVRKAVWPLRELVNGLQKAESDLMAASTMPFLRDIYDHIVQIIDTAEALREMASGMLEVYLSTVNNRMSSIMQVLTVIATVFIPLTFVAGIYGMNFEHMPELSSKWSYPFGFWAVVILTIGGMLAYFKKKKWF